MYSSTLTLRLLHVHVAFNYLHLDWYGAEECESTSLPKLHAVYLILERMGFSLKDTERAMHATGGQNLGNALNWLCIHLPADSLPTGFTDKLTASSAEIAAKLVAMTSSNDFSNQRGNNLNESCTAPAAKVAPKSIMDVADSPTPQKARGIDDRMKNWILQSAMSDDDDGEDLLLDKTPKSVPPALEHAALTLRSGDLKSIAQSAKQTGDHTIHKIAAEDLKKCIGRLKELEKERGFDRRKAEVELGKLLLSKPDHATKLLDEIKFKAAALAEKKTQDQLRKEEPSHDNQSDEENEDAEGGFGNLFDTEESGGTQASKHSTSTTVTVRKMQIAASWTGKTPKTHLNEYCAKQSRHSKIKFYKIEDSSSGYRSGVKIEGVPNKGDIKIIEMDKFQRVDNIKIADEFVAVGCT
jgi:hypothetical protein